MNSAVRFTNRLALDSFGYDWIFILASIYTAEDANALSVWPSPEQLKGRIVIR
ncbi:unnamed protein product, partial [Rotaria magnacalcarata]